jgi:hypothetical protein
VIGVSIDSAQRIVHGVELNSAKQHMKFLQQAYDQYGANMVSRVQVCVHASTIPHTSQRCYPDRKGRLTVAVR